MIIPVCTKLLQPKAPEKGFVGFHSKVFQDALWRLIDVIIRCCRCLKLTIVTFFHLHLLMSWQHWQEDFVINFEFGRNVTDLDLGSKLLILK